VLSFACKLIAPHRDYDAIHANLYHPHVCPPSPVTWCDGVFRSEGRCQRHNRLGLALGQGLGLGLGLGPGAGVRQWLGLG
jgi:hypothetical protein